MDKSLIIAVILWPLVALGQTHTFPGNNVFPSTSTTDFNAGATVDFTGATVTGLAGGGAVSSVFTRTGAVVALVGDYSAFYQPLDTDLTTWAGLTPSANFQTMVPHTFSQMRTDLSLVPGTNVEVPLTFSTGLTRSTNTVTVNTSQNIATLSNLTTNGFVKTGGAVGTLSVDTATYQATLTNSAGLRGALSDENGTGAALFNAATTPDFTTGFTIGAAAASGKIPIGNGTSYVPSTPTYPNAAGRVGYTVRSDGTNFTSYPQDMLNSSTASVGTSYGSDTYLVGSAVQVTAGDFKAGGQYHCIFDMTKTNVGTATPIITVRTGTGSGSVSDASRITCTFGAGTTVADTGIFEVFVTWRTIGSGTSATVWGVCRGQHNLATTGLFNNADQWTVVGTPSGGFDSTTQTVIGISFNGGASFSGTNTIVQAQLIQ